MIQTATFPTIHVLPAAHHNIKAGPQPAMSPSALFRQEARIQYDPSLAMNKRPQATEVTQVCGCMMCGAELHPNMTPPQKAIPVTKDMFGDSFNNKGDIKPGNVVCEDCETVWTGEFMQTHSKSYAVEGHGLFRLASALNIAAFVLLPPKAAYSAIFNTRKQGHLIWRTPVSYPGNDLMVRIDDDLISLNRSRVMNGVRAWQYIKNRLSELKLKVKEPALLSANLSFTNTGFILPVVEKAMNNDGTKSQKALADLKALSMGDWWAVCAMRDIDMDKPATWPSAQLLSPVIVGQKKEKKTDSETDVEA